MLAAVCSHLMSIMVWLLPSMTQAHRVMLEHIAGIWDRIAQDIADRNHET